MIHQRTEFAPELLQESKNIWLLWPRCMLHYIHFQHLDVKFCICTEKCIDSLTYCKSLQINMNILGNVQHKIKCPHRHDILFFLYNIGRRNAWSVKHWKQQFYVEVTKIIYANYRQIQKKKTVAHLTKEAKALTENLDCGMHYASG